MDTIDAVSEPTHEVVRRPAAGAEANQADARAIALYLFAQLYIRQAQRADAMDVWPSSSPQAAAAAATVSTLMLSAWWLCAQPRRMHASGCLACMRACDGRHAGLFFVSPCASTWQRSAGAVS